MDELVIFGSGGFAREVAQVVRDINIVQPRWSLLGFLDDDVSKHGTVVGGLPVLGGAEVLQSRPRLACSIGIGNPAAKHKIASRLTRTIFATLIHPRAWIGERVAIAEGAIICANATATCDITIGAHVIVNLSATIGHDARLADFSTLAPSVNISGYAMVGRGSDLGTGVAVIPSAKVGAWSIVGAGSVVVNDLPDNITAVGAPARVVKTREPGWHVR